MRRSLSLKRETLTELTSDDLAGVVGARNAPSGATCPVRDCVTAISDAHTCIDCLTRACD